MTELCVLMPHFQDPEAVELSLRSIEAQTWKGDREVIIADDGSSPETLSRLEEVVDRSSERVRLLRNRSNRGRPYTRNVLLDAADAQYAAWLDAGDEWYPTKLEWQIGTLEGDRGGIDGPVWCTCNYDWQWKGAKRRSRKQQVDGDQARNLLGGSLGAYLWTLVAETQAFTDVGYFDLRLPRLQDLDFFLRFATKGGRLVLPGTPEPLCVYHKTDVGRRGQEVLGCFKYLHRKHTAVLMQQSRKFRRKRKYDIHMHAARFTQNNGEHARTALYMGAAALHSPAAFTKKMIKDRGRL